MLQPIMECPLAHEDETGAVLRQVKNWPIRKPRAPFLSLSPSATWFLLAKDTVRARGRGWMRDGDGGHEIESLDARCQLPLVLLIGGTYTTYIV